MKGLLWGIVSGLAAVSVNGSQVYESKASESLFALNASLQKLEASIRVFRNWSQSRSVSSESSQEELRSMQRQASNLNTELDNLMKGTRGQDTPRRRASLPKGKIESDVALEPAPSSAPTSPVGGELATEAQIRPELPTRQHPLVEPAEATDGSDDALTEEVLFSSLLCAWCDLNDFKRKGEEKDFLSALYSVIAYRSAKGDENNPLYLGALGRICLEYSNRLTGDQLKQLGLTGKDNLSQYGKTLLKSVVNCEEVIAYLEDVRLKE